MRWFTDIILVFCCLSFAGQTLAIGPAYPSLYQVTIPDSLTADKLLELSDKYRFSAPKKAKAYAQKAVKVAEGSGNKIVEITGLYKLSWLYMDQGERYTAKPYFEDGLKKAKEIDNQFLTTEGYYLQSYFYESESDFAKAIDLLTQSLDTYEQLGQKGNTAKCYTSLGRIYSKLGSYDQALQYGFQSLRINEKLNNKRGISVVKTLIGMIYLQTDKLDEAHRNFSEGVSIAKEINDQDRVLVNTLDIGAVQQKRGLLDEALEKYKEALALARQLNYNIEEVLLLQNIGSTLREMGDHEESLSYVLSALDLGNKINFNASHVLNDVSETYLALQEPIRAEAYALKAIESSKKWSDLNQLSYGYLDLANAYEEQGDHKNAYATLQLYNSTIDSLFSLEKQRQMDELEVIYETEKKEQEIKLLTLQTQTAEFRRNAYLAGGLLATFILLLLYYGQRQKSKRNRQLLEKEQEVAEMKSNFFSNISHEFRTPLTLISGPIELIRAGTNDPKTRTLLDAMEKNADRLLSLINQLLDLSKLESGKLELSPTTTDIITLVKGVTMTFQSLAEMKKIDLSIKTRVEFLELKVDCEKVETILINLIKNAFTYTPEGGRVTVSLGIGKDHQGHDACQISVKDTGKGIPGQEIPHVFDRFYRGVDSEMEQTGGTGIGLALTKELVELHGGSIEVSSKEHEWTEFVVKLPMETANYAEENRSVIEVSNTVLPVESGPYEAVQSEASEEPLVNEESVPVVLLIEDNEDVMHYLKDILGDTYQVIEATDGEQGVASAFEHIPDLIISDVMMPKMNGYQVAETLKQDEKTSHIPLILLTAKAGQKDKMQGLKTHADEYLTKPFRPEELQLRIQNLIESRNKLREKHKREFMTRPDSVEVHSMDDAFLMRVKKIVDEHIDDEGFTVEKLGKEVGMSRSQLHRKLSALIDQSASEFIRSYRLHRAKDMITQNAGSISEISYAVGFGSPSYFSKCFREEFGFSPSEVKDKV